MKYGVQITKTTTYFVEVTADNEDEAKDEAVRLWESDPSEYYDDNGIMTEIV